MTLIDKAKLLNTIATQVHYDPEHSLEMYAKMLSLINDAPTVEAVPLENYKSMERTVNKMTKAIAEAEPVMHGHWQKRRNPMMYQIYPYVFVCSRCGTAFEFGTPYCGECGAKMDEVEDADK